MTGRRLGILGGTFDPPHLAHLEIARSALRAAFVDGVVLVPCFRHVFNKRPVAFEHRIEMCRRMAAGADFIEVSDVEKSLENPGRTLEMVEALQKKYPDRTFRLLLGADIYLERHKWYRFDLLELKAPPLYFCREGVSVQKETWLAAPSGMSSSELRQRMAKGESVSGFLDDSVWTYIVEHQLYGVKTWEEKSL